MIRANFATDAVTEFGIEIEKWLLDAELDIVWIFFLECAQEMLAYKDQTTAAAKKTTVSCCCQSGWLATTIATFRTTRERERERGEQSVSTNNAGRCCYY